MKRQKITSALTKYALPGIFTWVLTVSAFAAEEAASSGGWRSTWDEAMLWLNFCILAFVIFKYGRQPLKDFLRGKSREIEKQIGRVEKQKQEIENQIRETRKAVEESETRFESLKMRIIKQGERRKVQLIEDAKSQSEIMLTMSKRKIEGQVKEAKDSFKAELVDAAIDLALERLPKEVTEEDNHRFVDQYLSAT